MTLLDKMRPFNGIRLAERRGVGVKALNVKTFLSVLTRILRRNVVYLLSRYLRSTTC